MVNLALGTMCLCFEVVFISQECCLGQVIAALFTLFPGLGGRFQSGKKVLFTLTQKYVFVPTSISNAVCMHWCGAYGSVLFVTITFSDEMAVIDGNACNYVIDGVGL